MGGRFFVQLFLNVIITMICIAIVKGVSKKFNVPGLRTLSDQV